MRNAHTYRTVRYKIRDGYIYTYVYLPFHIRCNRRSNPFIELNILKINAKRAILCIIRDRRFVPSLFDQFFIVGFCNFIFIWAARYLQMEECALIEQVCCFCSSLEAGFAYEMTWTTSNELWNPHLEMMKIILISQWTWTNSIVRRKHRISDFTHFYLRRKKISLKQSNSNVSNEYMYDNEIYFFFALKIFAYVPQQRVIPQLVPIPSVSHATTTTTTKFKMTHNTYREKNSHMFRSCVCDYHKWETAGKKKPQLH